MVMGSSPVRVATFVPLTQLVEYMTFNHGVKGSSPLRCTICDSSSVGRVPPVGAEVVGSSPTESLVRDFFGTYSSANQTEGW